MVAASLHSIFLLTTFSASPGFQHPCEKYFQSATSIRESSKTSSSALYLFFSSSQTSLKIEKIRSICYFLLGNKRHIEFPTRKIRPLVISVLKIRCRCYFLPGKICTLKLICSFLSFGLMSNSVIYYNTVPVCDVDFIQQFI